MKKSILLAFGLSSLVAIRMHALQTSGSLPKQSSHTFSGQEIGRPEKVECKVDAGSIIIRGADKDFSCKYTAHNVDPQKTIKVKRGTKTLHVEFEKSGIFKRQDNAKADFEVVVPKNCEVKIKMGAGSIDVRAVDGKVKVDLGSGSLKAFDLMKDSEFDIGYGVCDLSHKNSKLNAPKKCKLKGGSLKATIGLPSQFCVKNKVDTTPFAVTVENSFAPCPTTPDIELDGSIGFGVLTIKKQ